MGDDNGNYEDRMMTPAGGGGGGGGGGVASASEDNNGATNAEVGNNGTMPTIMSGEGRF
jgi:hypothetical protein